MTISSSKITLIPKRFSGLRVLLIEPDISSLRHHKCILSLNSYRVTSTMKASTGLSMILNGHTYDCVLIDGDIHEMDIMDFLHQIVKHQPQLSIIIMASDGVYSRIIMETLKNEAIMCLLKPCGLRDICNIWKHISRKRIIGDSNGKSSEEHQDRDIVKRVDPVVNQLTTLNWSTMINNNISSAKDTQGLNINSQEHGARYKQVTYVDLSSDDDDQEHVGTTTSKEYYRTGTTKKTDKGKQPVMINDNIASSKGIQEGLNINSLEHGARFGQVTYEDLFSDNDDQGYVMGTTNINSCTTKTTDRGKQPAVVCKSTNDQPVEDDRYCKKKKITWTPELHQKFLDALNTLGEQKAYPRTILQLMNVPCLTRTQVNSHLQKHQDRTRRPSVVPPIKRDINLQGLIVCKRCGYLNPCKDGSSDLTRSLNHNSTGTSYMNIDNINAMLQGARPAPVPQRSTTIINNSGGNHATKHSFGKQFQPPMRERCMIATSGLIENSNSGGQVNEVQMTGYNTYRNIKEPLIVAETVAMVPLRVAETEAMAPVLNICETVVPGYDLGMDGNNNLYGFDDGNSGSASGSGSVREALASLDGFESTIYCPGVSGDALTPLGVGEIVAPDYDSLGMDERNFWNGFDNGNSGDAIASGVSEAQAPLDSIGIGPESWVTGKDSAVYGLGAVMEPMVSENTSCFRMTNSIGGVAAASSNNGHEDLAMPEFDSFDIDLHLQDFQEIGEDLLAVLPDSATSVDVENSINPSLPDFESVPFGHGSIGDSLPSFPSEQNNSQARIQPSVDSGIALDGSDVGVIEDDSFLNLSPDFVMKLLDEDDGDLINRPW